MSKLTLDEAIKHCEEVAEQNETQANKWQEEGGEQWGKTTACRECATDHRQLAEWLRELKEAKQLLKAAMKDMKMLYESGKDEGCVGIEFKWRYADEALKLIES